MHCFVTGFQITITSLPLKEDSSLEIKLIKPRWNLIRHLLSCVFGWYKLIAKKSPTHQKESTPAWLSYVRIIGNGPMVIFFLETFLKLQKRNDLSYYLKHSSNEISQLSYSGLNSHYIVIILPLSGQMGNGYNSQRVIKITNKAYAIQ